MRDQQRHPSILSNARLATAAWRLPTSRQSFEPLNNEKAAGLKSVVDSGTEPHKYVYVYGHTDSRGTPGYNIKLARSRAAFVKRRLVQYGIPAEMVIVKSFGETKPASKENAA